MTTYGIVLWFGSLNKQPRENTRAARAEAEQYPKAPHLDPRGRELVNGALLDLSPEEVIWLSERYDVMVTRGNEAPILALTAKGDRFGQR